MSSSDKHPGIINVDGEFVTFWANGVSMSVRVAAIVEVWPDHSGRTGLTVNAGTLQVRMVDHAYRDVMAALRDARGAKAWPRSWASVAEVD